MTSPAELDASRQYMQDVFGSGGKIAVSSVHAA